MNNRYTGVTVAGRYEEIEEELRICREAFRAVSLNASDIVCRVDLESGEIHIPEERAALLGLPSIIKNAPKAAISAGFIAKTSEADFNLLYEKALRGECDSRGVSLGAIDNERFLVKSTVVKSETGAPKIAVLTFSPIAEQKKRVLEISELEESEQLIRILAEHSNKSVIKYHFKADEIETIGRAPFEFFERISPPYTMERFINSRFVAPESVETLRVYKRVMREGSPMGSFKLKALNNGEKWEWYNCIYTTIFDLDRPVYAVISCENINDDYVREIAFLRLRDMTRADAGINSFALDVNLSRNTLERMEGVFVNGFKPEEGMSYAECIRGLAERTITASQRKDYIEFLSQARLMSEFSHGVNKGEHDFCAMTSGKDSETNWINMHYQLIRDPYSSDVRLWINCDDIDSRKRSELKLLEQAQKDSVTSLLNRATFTQQVRERISSIDMNRVHAFAMVDVDRFKRVNDAFGHAFGDRVLRDVALTLRSVMFRDDIIGRIGGDEFALCMSGFQDMEIVKEKFRILTSSVFRELESAVKVSVSIGVALCPRDGASFAELYEKADIALYHAKNTGRNRYVFYEDGLPTAKNRTMISPIECVDSDGSSVYLRTFGEFSALISGVPVAFPNEKARELLALLTDRSGEWLSAALISGVLYPNVKNAKYAVEKTRGLIKNLRETLSVNGIENILETVGSTARLNTDSVKCDMFNYLSGESQYKHLYAGAYMTGYAWADASRTLLNARRQEL